MKNNRIILTILGASLVGTALADSKPAAQVKAPEAKVAAAGDKKGQELNIRVVDAFEVMQKSSLGSEVTLGLSDTNQKMSTEITQKGKEIEQDILAYDSKKATMSEASREKEEKRLVKAKRDYQVLVEEKNQEFQGLQAKASERILKEVRESAATIAQAESIDIIADKTTGQILYSSAKADVSDKLIGAMNTKYAANKKATATIADNKKNVSAVAAS
jgi:Skp family chaperone for outer membrane proteins